jgi:ribosome-binding factor A
MSQKNHDRQKRFSSVLKQALSEALLHLGLSQACIIEVDVSADLKQALVWLNSQNAQETQNTINKINAEKKQLMSWLKKTIYARYLPNIVFNNYNDICP